MMKESVIHIIPIGFEEDRAISGLLELGASKIYFLIDGKLDKWGDEARRHAAIVEDKLKQVMINSSILEKVPFDPTSYQSCDEAVSELLEREKDASKIYLNVSSSTKLCAIAFALKAARYKNAFLYYVVPKDYNLPASGQPFSSGAKRIEVFSPRSDFGQTERRIIDALGVRSFSSLRDLSEVLNPQDVNKAQIAKLSYYIRKLESEGFVEFVPSKKIALTVLGKNKVNPFTDDAKLEDPQAQPPQEQWSQPGG